MAVSVVTYTEDDLERLEGLVWTCAFKRKQVQLYVHAWTETDKGWPARIEFFDKLFIDGYVSRVEWFSDGTRFTKYLSIPKRFHEVFDAVHIEVSRRVKVVEEAYK